MKILGIDPGTHRIGWGIIEKSGSKAIHIESGIIELPPHTKEDIYLPKLYDSLNQILIKHKPDVVGIEKLFFQTNAKTAITVAQGRGVILLSVSQANIPYLELSPNTIKSAVTGDGSCDKKAVTRMVGLLLNLDTKNIIDDTCDALAIALTAGTIKL